MGIPKKKFEDRPPGMITLIGRGIDKTQEFKGFKETPESQLREGVEVALCTFHESKSGNYVCDLLTPEEVRSLPQLGRKDAELQLKLLVKYFANILSSAEQVAEFTGVMELDGYHEAYQLGVSLKVAIGDPTEQLYAAIAMDMALKINEFNQGVFKGWDAVTTCPELVYILKSNQVEVPGGARVALGRDERLMFKPDPDKASMDAITEIITDSALFQATRGHQVGNKQIFTIEGQKMNYLVMPENMLVALAIRENFPHAVPALGRN